MTNGGPFQGIAAIGRCVDVSDVDGPVPERLAAWAYETAGVRAALLTGSRSRPGAALDRFSDYDVILYVMDPAACLADPAWFSAYGEVLVSFQDRGGFAATGGYTQLVLYEDGVKIDFTLAPVAELDRMCGEGWLSPELDLGYTVLVDKDGRADALPAPSGRAWIPAPPTQAAFTALVEEFWWESGYVAKNLARGELLPAKYSLESVMKLDLLRRMLEWRVGTEHWSWRPGVLGRGLRDVLDPGTWREFEETCVGAAIEENWTALFRTTELFRAVARTVAARLSLDYPDGLDARMSAWLQAARTE